MFSSHTCRNPSFWRNVRHKVLQKPWPFNRTSSPATAPRLRLARCCRARPRHHSLSRLTLTSWLFRFSIFFDDVDHIRDFDSFCHFCITFALPIRSIFHELFHHTFNLVQSLEVYDVIPWIQDCFENVDLNLYKFVLWKYTLDLMAQNTNERGKISASDCGFNLPTVFGSLETGSQRLNQEEQVPYLLIWTLAIILLYRCPKYSHSENEYYRKQNQHQSVNEECRHFLLASRISYFCLILMTMLRFIFDNTLDSKD